MMDDEFINDDGYTDDADGEDFDSKVEAAYRKHAGARPKANASRPNTATQRRPISAEDKKKAESGARAIYKPKVSDTVLREVRNTITPSFNSLPNNKIGQKQGSAPTRVALNRPQTANSNLNSSSRNRQAKTSSEYLRIHNDKQKKVKEEQDDMVDQCLRELHYSYLYKMGEMNEWCNALGLRTLYRAYKHQDGDLNCHVYENGMFVKELSMKLMEKRYKALQGRYSDATARGQIECDEAKPRNFALTEEEQCKRQQEIREVLLQTMHLTSQLRDQLAVLEKQDNRLTPFVQE